MVLTAFHELPNNLSRDSTHAWKINPDVFAEQLLQSQHHVINLQAIANCLVLAAITGNDRRGVNLHFEGQQHVRRRGVLL